MGIEEELLRRLTNRESSVLELMARGLANAEIASTLGISSHTVKVHVTNVLHKLGAANRTEAVGLFRGVQQEQGALHAAPSAPARVPALAVLPFFIAGGSAEDAAHRRFSEGLVDDLITRLGRRWFPVIARCSTFSLRGQELTDARVAGQAVDARFLVEGSTQREQHRIRTNVRLVDAADGRVLWSHTYACEDAEMFDAQEEIACEVVSAASVAAIHHVARQSERLPEPQVAAWEWAARGMSQFWQGTRAQHDAARRSFEQALERDPEMRLALYGSALLCQREVLEHWTDSLEGSRRALSALSTRFLSVHPFDPWSNLVAAYVAIYAGDRDNARERVRFALEQEPSSVRARSLHGQLLAMQGDVPSALSEITHAIRLSPRAPDLWSQQCVMALAHFAGGQYEAAVEWATRSARSPAAGSMPFNVLASSHSHLGDVAGARSALAEVKRRQQPGVDGYFAPLLASTDPEISQRFIAGLKRAAG